LGIRRDDVDFQKGTVIARFSATGNKGNRDQLINLHPVAAEHLRRLPSFNPLVFSWPHGRRQLYEAFEAVQAAAGVRPQGTKKRYTFHDLRRGFATMNAGRMTPEALQALMQPRDLQTTMVYINIARQLAPAVENLFVPDLPGRAVANG
jgi:integrase